MSHRFRHSFATRLLAGGYDESSPRPLGGVTGGAPERPVPAALMKAAAKRATTGAAIPTAVMFRARDVPVHGTRARSGTV
ncbi:MAG: hypothetical protein P4L84_28950 [Isosphaeraceae bacterium]|nr:hypothetical protein [Isosphaeraceae bacterium]